MNVSRTARTLAAVIALGVALAPNAHAAPVPSFLLSSDTPNALLLKMQGDSSVYKITLADGVSTDEALAQYRKIPGIAYLEKDTQVHATAFPSDPDYSYQWYLDAINAKDAWSQELITREQDNNTSRPIIAILDTGVDGTHPDLKDKMFVNTREKPGDKIDNDGNGFIDDVSGWDFVDNDNNASPVVDANAEDSDAILHGTLVAGIAAATTNNAQGIAGVAWSARIMPLRVLDSTGAGDVYAVAQAIDYAVANGASVINMSFVGTEFNQTLFDAIKRAYDHGVIVVAAAGNTDSVTNGLNLDLTKSYPICYDGQNGENMVIGVASVDRDNKKSLFSNYGSCVDISAPGEQIYSTTVYQPAIPGFDKYYNGYWSGTSLATPIVTGVIATLEGMRPALSSEQIKKVLLSSARDITAENPGYLGKLGSGVVDFAAAVNAIIKKDIGTTVEPTSDYIITGLGFKSFPQLKVVSSGGDIFKSFFAYAPTFNGAVVVASGDVNGDGKQEIVTVPGSAGGPHVRVFNIEGHLVSQFFAADQSFRGGLSVAVGDVTGDAADEIIVGMGKGSKPLVKVFTGQGKLLYSFTAYTDKFTGGVNVAVGDTNADGKQEIITTPASGGGPHVRIFDGTGKPVSEFFAFNKQFKGGLSVAAGDITGDGIAEIVVSPIGNTSPTVRVFNQQGTQLNEFLAFDPSYLGGMTLAIGDLDGNGIQEIVAGAAKGIPTVRTLDRFGNLKNEFVAAQSDTYRGGVRVGIFKH